MIIFFNNNNFFLLSFVWNRTTINIPTKVRGLMYEIVHFSKVIDQSANAGCKRNS